MGQLASALTTRVAFSALSMPKRGALTRQARIQRGVGLHLGEATRAELHGGDRVIARLKWQVSLLGSHKALAGRRVRTEKRCVRQRERLRQGVPLRSFPAPAGAEPPKSPSPEGVGGPPPGVGLRGWSRGFP